MNVNSVQVYDGSGRDRSLLPTDLHCKNWVWLILDHVTITGPTQFAQRFLDELEEGKYCSLILRNKDNVPWLIDWRKLKEKLYRPGTPDGRWELWFEHQE